MHLDHVARRAGGLRHDGGVAPRQKVEQRGFAGIGRADDGDAQPLAQPRAAPVVEMRRSICGFELDDLPGDARADAVGQVLVGKIDRGFEMGQRAQAERAPVLVEPVQCALHLRQRLAPLLSGFGGDQVGDALGRGEVELAVLEGAAGEFAGLGEAAEAELGEGIEQGAHHGATAVAVQLDHGLAGLGVRRLEPHDQAAVDLLAAQRIDQGPHHPPRHRAGRIARRMAAFERPRLGEEDQRISGARTADTDDGQRARCRPAGRRRAQGIDRGAGHGASRCAWVAPGPAPARLWAPGRAGTGRAITLSAILSYSAFGDQPALDQLGLGLVGPRPDDGIGLDLADAVEVIRSSREALLRSIWAWRRRGLADWAKRLAAPSAR